MPMHTPTIAMRLGPPCRQKGLIYGKESSDGKYGLMIRHQPAALFFDQTREECLCSAHFLIGYPRMKEVAQTVVSCLIWNACLPLLPEESNAEAP